AIKVVRSDWPDQATAIKLIQREARAGLRVKHPQLVRVREAHVTTSPHFLVMDWLSGESLRRRIRREFYLDTADAVGFVRRAAEALAALQRAGLVHGDVKPDNIRITDAGEAVLIDLGFAHRPGENARLCLKGYILGTVNYLAPELCIGEEHTDYASDVFSLG